MNEKSNYPPYDSTVFFRSGELSTYFTFLDWILVITESISPRRYRDSRQGKIMALQRSASCEFTSFAHGAGFHTDRERKERRTRSDLKKGVQWSDDLEEIRYFVPERSRSESIRRKFNKAKKKKAEQFKEKPLVRAFTSSAESRSIRLCLIGGHVNCFSLDSGAQSFEEYNKQWDRLFEMYSTPNLNYSTY